MNNRKPHYLRVDYPDKTVSHDRILSMGKNGLWVSRYGVPLHISAGWLDENDIHIDGYGKWLVRPYREQYWILAQMFKHQKGPLRVEPRASQKRRVKK